MKLAVIGGGGVRSLYLARSLAQKAQELGIQEIVFMDVDEQKLNLFGKMARQVALKINKNLTFRLTTNPVEAIQQANCIITTLRVGGDEMRIGDERIALNLNLLGQETTGAAGFSYAMRSIPILAEYCELVRRHAAPDAKVFNFTNPVGLVSQALVSLGYHFTYGICDAPSGFIKQVSQLYQVPPESIRTNCFGLNHLSFFSSIRWNDTEMLPQIIQNPKAYTDTELRYFEPELVQSLGVIPNEYLYYYFYREKAVENILKSPQTRGEVILHTNQNMLRELSQINVEENFEAALAIYDHWYGEREKAYMANETGVTRSMPEYHFNPFEPDEGGYAGVALKYIQAVGRQSAEHMILNLPNGNTVNWLAPEDTIEVSGDISAKGFQPCSPPPLPQVAQETIRRMKTYERVGSKAILEKSREGAIQALMMNPLVNSYSLAKTLADAYIQHNSSFSGGWK